jgi:pimeloyl-ACP methyl ester carboxylesterase
MLEVIDKGQISERIRTRVLFLHGAWHGAWCWSGHFVAFFATQGFRVLAPSTAGLHHEPITP